MRILLIIFLFVLLYNHSRSQNLDIDILRDVNLNRNHSMDETFQFISNSVSPVTIGTPVVLLTTGLFTKDSLLVRKALYVGASVVTASIIVTGIKHTVNRVRPYNTYTYLEKESTGGSPSFPSGHTSDAFSLATSLSLANPKWYVIVPSFTWATLVGYSRMDLGVHYPSDVLIGALLGAGSAYLCYKGQKWLLKKMK